MDSSSRNSVEFYFLWSKATKIDAGQYAIDVGQACRLLHNTEQLQIALQRALIVDRYLIKNSPTFSITIKNEKLFDFARMSLIIEVPEFRYTTFTNLAEQLNYFLHNYPIQTFVLDHNGDMQINAVAGDRFLRFNALPDEFHCIVNNDNYTTITFSPNLGSFFGQLMYDEERYDEIKLVKKGTRAKPIVESDLSLLVEPQKKGVFKWYYGVHCNIVITLSSMDPEIAGEKFSPIVDIIDYTGGGLNNFFSHKPSVAPIYHTLSSIKPSQIILSFHDGRGLPLDFDVDKYINETSGAESFLHFSIRRAPLLLF